MSRKLTVLDRINVSSPCSADWNEMKGNDVVRFCEHCNLNVTDLSSMTRTKATKLVLKSKGRLCVRYIKNPDGAIQTATQKVYQISRRASRITAGVFSAVLSLSATAFAQSQTSTAPIEKEIIVTTETLKQKSETVTGLLKGIILDSNGAVVPGAHSTIKNDVTGIEQILISDSEGVLVFNNLPIGTYTLTIEIEGFKKMIVEKIVVEETLPATVEINLIPAGEIVVVGGGMIVYEAPLLAAVSNDDVGAVRELLAKKGVKVNAKEEGTTALHIAVSYNNAEIVSLLLAARANPNIRDEEKQPALMRIHSDTSTEIIELLLRAGAKVNVKDNEGQTPLMAAAESGNIEIVRLLLTAGAKVDKQDKEGRTALMYAVEEENFEIVKVILAAGADINIRDNEGKSALSFALETDNEEIIKWLKGYGAYEQEEPSNP